MSPFFALVVGSLAVWRITHLLNSEDGPWDVVVRLRRRVGVGFWGSLLGCFYCLSLWCAAPAAYLLAPSWTERLWLWPALSGAAILLERVTGGLMAVQYEEREEDRDALLRKRPESLDQ